MGAKEPPHDFGHHRSLNDPPDGCTIWVSKDDFNAIAKIAFSHNLSITCKRAKKDLGTHNQQRIAEIRDSVRPQLYWAPENCQTKGQTRLLRTNANYKTRDGEFKFSILYTPGDPDTEVDDAIPMRVIPRLDHQGATDFPLRLPTTTG